MLSDFAKNEIALSCEYIKSHGLLPEKSAVISIVGEHFLCGYIGEVLSDLNNKNGYKFTVYQVSDSDALSSTVSKQCFLYCFDARYQKDISDLKKALEYAKKTDNSQFVLLSIIPPLKKQSDVMAYSEMELSCVLTDTVLGQAEELLSLYRDELTIKEIRFDNFLSEACDENPINLSAIVDDIKSKNEIVLSDSDAFDFVSAISISDAVCAVFTVMCCGKHGNIYNASGYSMSLFEFKSYLYQLVCGYGVALKTVDGNKNSNKEYRVLGIGKLKSLGFEHIGDRYTQLLYAVSDILPTKFDIIKDKTHAIYDNKLDSIRKCELDILLTVDKICRENGIKYFLSGGSMLGAVRHKGFIPWDDDIDISMLRADFEKFRALCKEKLPEGYRYQTYQNKDGYHYFFDKITVNNTYFSTKYSDGFDMQKGISMDIFAFDNTADSKLFQKLHFKALMTFRLIMNVRWINRPRKGKSYLLSKLILPILRIFSMDSYSKMYDKLLRLYEHKNARFVLPPATDHNDRGVMPKKWFDEVIDAPFESVVSSIPVGYDEYLKIWYGDDYMQMLPLYKRIGSHDFYRLDMGDNLPHSLSDDTKKNFSYKGELL